MYGRRKTFAYALATWLCAAAFSGAAHANSLPLPDHARYAIKHFGERFGLGAVTVTSLAQDEQGLLWIGTETGLFRYDGAGVTHFGRDEGLRGEIVQLVLAAPDGTVWVRTRKGISRLDHEKFSSVSLPEEAGGLRDVYQSFAVDRAGTIFAATQRGLVSVDSEGASHIYSKADGLPGLEVDAVVCSHDDIIWFASGEKIGLLRGSSGAQIVSSLQLGQDRIVALLPAPDRRLWIRTAHRVGALDTKSAASSPIWFDQGIPGANVLGGPSLDQHGNLLLPTERGLYQRIGNDWKVIDHHSGLTSNAITAALEDREDGIWIGTAGAGLDHWPGSKQWSGWTDAPWARTCATLWPSG